MKESSIANSPLRITVFGASNPKPGEPAYAQAQRLGSLLGEKGFTVLTGGYSGTMEAVSRGANEAGGHVIGVTCQELEDWRPVKANPWVKEEVKCSTLVSRIDQLLTLCDAAMALPGGVGTLAEITVMWNRMLIQSLPQKPLFLIGNSWRETMLVFLSSQGQYIPDHDKALISFANTVEESMKMLNLAEKTHSKT